MARFFVYGIILLKLFAPLPAWCGGAEARASDVDARQFTAWEKYALANGAGIAALAAWGFTIWRYGDRDSPHVRYEGAFGKETKHGGMDKLGHGFTGYLLALETARASGRWGFGDDEAPWLGLGSSLFFTTMMEVGDSFSDFGLSPEDLVANAAGAGLGFAFAKWPVLQDYLDYRVEYRPPFGAMPRDVITDYKRMRFHAVFKLAGFPALAGTPWRYAEFHVGYFTRGFMGTGGEPEYTLFVGAGVNLAELLSEAPFSRVFKYFQVPGTYADRGWTF